MSLAYPGLRDFVDTFSDDQERAEAAHLRMEERERRTSEYLRRCGVVPYREHLYGRHVATVWGGGL